MTRDAARGICLTREMQAFNREPVLEPSLPGRHILARGGNSAIRLATAASSADRVLALMLLGTLAHEAGRPRRMMAVSAHDRISGTPQMVRVWDEFPRYAKSRPGVAFLRKDEIARYTRQSPLTLRESETI